MMNDQSKYLREIAREYGSTHPNGAIKRRFLEELNMIPGLNLFRKNGKHKRKLSAWDVEKIYKHLGKPDG